MDTPAVEEVVGGTDGSWGTVVALWGRYFVGAVDLLTRERYKTLVPLSGSPFAVAGEPDPALQRSVEEEGASVRARREARRDLGAWFRDCGAHALVLDNTAALLPLAEINGRLYTLVQEDSDFMAAVRDRAGLQERDRIVRPARQGFTPELRVAYDEFVDACLAHFPPERIVLVRSRAAALWSDEEGCLRPTGHRDHDSRLLADLDAHFVERTGCLVSDAALDHVPMSPDWRAVDPPLQAAIERDVVDLLTTGRPASVPDPNGSRAGELSRATRHLLQHLAAGRPVDRGRLRASFEEGGADIDDLLALLHLGQERPGQFDRLVRYCVRRAVADPSSRPLAATRRRFERSLAALRSWRWCRVSLPDGDPWQPQITLRCGRMVVRLLADGSIERIATAAVEEADAPALADAGPVTTRQVEGYLGSWPTYLERGRRGITEAPSVVVEGARELLDSCTWLDWRWLLMNENLVVSTPTSRRPWSGRPPAARTDLSFLFAPRTRIGTVGGGLMDQVTHIALFDELCGEHDLDLVLDDLRYVWWRSHNGFEASRLAPDLERRRITRRVSTLLLERYRTEVRQWRLPWVYNQSRAWLGLGLREAFVVTRDYPNSRRLVEEFEPSFPLLVYPTDDDLAEHVRRPPGPVTFYTTQHRIAVAESSAGPLGRIFSYHHLEEEGLPPEVAATAAVLRASPHVAFHVRRGDFLHAHFDRDGWFSWQEHYVDAIDFLVKSELGTTDVDVAVFSDDLEFVEANTAAYGLDRVAGTVRFIRGNRHYESIHDSYLMSLCPVIVGSVGNFAATTSLLADPPSTYIRTRPGDLAIGWRRR